MQVWSYENSSRKIAIEKLGNLGKQLQCSHYVDNLVLHSLTSLVSEKWLFQTSLHFFIFYVYQFFSDGSGKNYQNRIFQIEKRGKKKRPKDKFEVFNSFSAAIFLIFSIGIPSIFPIGKLISQHQTENIDDIQPVISQHLSNPLKKNLCFEG